MSRRQHYRRPRSNDGARDARQAGFSIFEIVVATAVLMVATLIAFESVGTISRVGWTTFDKAQATRVSAAALNALSQDVVSATILFDPQSQTDAGVPAGYALLLYSEASGSPECVQWRVANGSLQVRQWPNSWVSGNPVPLWSTLLGPALGRSVSTTAITNSGSAQAPFSLDPGTNYQTQGSPSVDRLLDVHLFFDQQTAETPIEVQTSIAARNATSNLNPLAFYCPVEPSP